MAIDLNGFWICLEDGGFYYLRQIGELVVWVGMSTDQGLQKQMTLQNGLQFCNLFWGTLSEATIDGQWSDVPRGLTNNYGSLSLSVSIGGGLDSGGGFGPQLRKQSETGGFSGSTWVRLPVTLPGPPLEINEALKQIPKCTTYWDVGDAQFERESLHRNFGDAIKDSVALYGKITSDPDGSGTPANPVSDGYPYDRAPSLDYFWDNPDNHGDCDVTFYINVDLEREKAPLGLFDSISQQNDDLANVLKKILGPIECELIMFSRHEKYGAPLRPGWAETSGNSVLLNGRPLDGNVVADATQFATSIGNLSPQVGFDVRVAGSLVWDVGHYGSSRGDKLELHPIYAVDIITAIGIDDLTGAWGTRDGGTCYIRQLPGDTIWFLWIPPYANLTYATLFRGNRNGNTITGSWIDLPLGARASSGTLRLTVQPGNCVLLPDDKSVFSDQAWVKLYDTDLGSVCAFSDTAEGSDMMRGLDDLRAFRDRELMRTTRGRRYVRLVQEHGLEVVRHLRSNTSLRSQAAHLLRDLIALTQSSSSARPLTVRPDVLQLARRVLVGISAKGSPQLQAAIDEVRDDLEPFKGKTLLDGLHAAVRAKRKRSNRREGSS